MSEFREIKKRLFDEERIEDLLDELECWSIETEQGGKLYVAGLPDGDNKRSVQVRNNESLTSHIRSKGVDGDIFDIVSFIKFDADTVEKRESTLYKSKFWICQKFNYYEYIDDFYRETSDKQPVKPSFNKWLNELKKSRNKELSYTPNQTYPIEIVEQFSVVPYLNWLNEGLLCKTQKEFMVGIDVRSDRITFPVHNKQGEIVGVKGRYCGTNSEIESNYKYLYIYPCNKSIEFFNFHRALPYILENKEAIIVEGGKTTMFLWQWGYRNSISIEGDSLSQYQIEMLKELGLDIKFIFAYDKDKDAEYVKNEAMKLTGRLKYGIYDMENKLCDKDSPTDRGKEVWDYLYQNNIYKIK